MGYFFNKKRQSTKPSLIISNKPEQSEAKETPSANVVEEVSENKKTNEEKVMTKEEKVQAIEKIVFDEKPVKKIKKEKGLIERTESSKVILTEDNKQLLMD